MEQEANRIKNIFLNFIVPIGCFGATAVLFFAIIYPSIKNIPQLENQLAQAKVTNGLLKDKIAKLHRFQDFKAVLEENSGLVNQVMPIEENVPGLLDQVNEISDESGMELSRLSYSITDVGGKEEQTTGYSTVVVSLGSEGNYDQMVTFMKTIENASRMVNITNFRFGTSGKDNSKLSLTFVLSAPYLDVQSSAVTDEPLTLDVSSGDFVDFISKVKSLRYFEQSGDLSDIEVEVTRVEDASLDASNTIETTGSVGTGGGL